MPTKEELEAELSKGYAVIEELKSEIAARDAALHQSNVSGWLVVSPNPVYSGVTNGVQFTNGKAFVPNNHQGAQGIINVLTGDFGYEATEMTAEDYQAIKSRAPVEHTPTMLERLEIPQVITGDEG